MLKKLKMRKLFILLAFVGVISQALAQGERKDKTAVTFEELYDEPYSVNKLFIGFQPLYGEVFSTNVNAGFGVEASYYLKEKMDFKVNFRMPYSASFYDLSRDLAKENEPKFVNSAGNIVDMINSKPVNFTYFEIGGTYHIKDFDKASKTKMVLYKNSYKGDKWASRVPLRAEVPCKVRNIYGARLGGMFWQSSTDLTRAMDKQKISNTDLVNSEGVGLPPTYFNPITGQTENMNIYGNIHSANVYLGGSMSWIRNVAVSFDKFEEGVDDGMLTAYLDLIIAPSLKLDPISYTDPITKVRMDYSTDAIKTNPVGFRLGIDGKFNRTLSWGYGGEFGYRPSVQGRGFFAMFKISLPLYGTNLDYKVESFGK
jgi:hypothetical protein